MPSLRCFPELVFLVSLSLAGVSLPCVYRKLNTVKHITESWWAFIKLFKLRSHWVVLHVLGFVSGRLQCGAQISVMSQSWMIGETMCWLENLVMGALRWVKVIPSPLDNWCDSSEQSTLYVVHSDMERTPLVTQQIPWLSHAFGERLRALLSEETFLLWG